MFKTSAILLINMFRVVQIAIFVELLGYQGLRVGDDGIHWYRVSRMWLYISS
jgi:hypothetical protein